MPDALGALGPLLVGHGHDDDGSLACPARQRQPAGVRTHVCVSRGRKDSSRPFLVTSSVTAAITSSSGEALPATTALEMGTIRGARALGMDKEIGSLETGKRADMIEVRLDRPNAVPLYDAISQMVYALKGDDVRDVMVNGKPVVRDAKILTLDEAAILAKAEEYRVKVSASLKK